MDPQNIEAITPWHTKYEWNDKCDEAFQEIKRMLTSASVLVLPSNCEDFVVYGDASKNGLG